MPELPSISGDEAIKVFKRLGFFEARQRGSYVVMRREDKGCVIPRHKQLANGTLRSTIRQAGITLEEFVTAYENRYPLKTSPPQSEIYPVTKGRCTPILPNHPFQLIPFLYTSELIIT